MILMNLWTKGLVFLLFPHESIAEPDQWCIHASWGVWVYFYLFVYKQTRSS